jgi:hypothetical protein
MTTIQQAAIMADLFGFDLVCNADRGVVECYCEGHLIWEAEW